VTYVLHASGYGRVAITPQIKAVLLSNRYVDFGTVEAPADGRAKGDSSAAGVYPPPEVTGIRLLWLLTDR
jgi:hypothetical protein